MNNIFSSEIICMALALLVLFFMLHSKPMRTRVYSLCLWGTVLVLYLLVLEVVICAMALKPKTVDYDVFDLHLLMYLFAYLCILSMIVIYVCSLSAWFQKNVAGKLIYYVIGIVVVMTAATVLTKKGYMYEVKEDFIAIDNFIRFYMAIGVFGATASLIETLRNRKHVSNTVFTYIMLFIPADLFIMILQFMIPHHIFSGISFVVPFIIFYFLFHSNPYDAATGCQNEEALEARFLDYVKRKVPYSLTFIVLPQLANVDFFNYLGDPQRVIQLFADTCREVEQLEKGTFIYKLNDDSFAVLKRECKSKRSSDYVSKVEGVISKYCDMVGRPIYYKIVSFHENPEVKSSKMMKTMGSFLFAKIMSDQVSQCYEATEKDYEDFALRYKIEQMLLDIRNKMDLDDERVLCYVQPIYSVKKDAFRTAEALMRLKLGDTIIYPDKFISLAEKNNCIHTLTCIILNKVCKNIEKLRTEYDFDAITVNCSSLELSSERSSDDILDVINKNNTPTSYIRLELTESAMFENFDVVKKNLEKMRASGVNFYLDDFGTGYSNLERIIGCPFHTIKFDKSLLYKSIDDSSMCELVTEMIQVLKKKGFNALVEGVEDDLQRDFSIKSGFEYIQGYRYSRPIPVEELNGFFTKI